MTFAFRARMLALAFASAALMLASEMLMMRKLRGPRPGKLRLSV